MKMTKKHAFTVIMRKCSEALKAQLYGTEDFTDIKDDQHLIELLKLICCLVC